MNEKFVCYLDIRVSKLDVFFPNLKVCVRWNDSSFKNQDGLDQASQTARAFKMPNIGLDGTDVEAVRSTTISAKDVGYPPQLSDISGNCASPMCLNIAYIVGVEASALVDGL